MVSCYFSFSKACRCYQKAFDLDPDSDDAGTALGDSLTELGDEVNNRLLNLRPMLFAANVAHFSSLIGDHGFRKLELEWFSTGCRKTLT